MSKVFTIFVIFLYFDFLRGSSIFNFHLIEKVERNLIQEFIQNGTQNLTFGDIFGCDDLLDHTDTPRNLTKLDQSCFICNIRFYAAFLLRREFDWSRQQLYDFLVESCISFGADTREECEGNWNLNLDPLLFAIDHQPALTSQIVCAMLLQGECGEITEPEFDFAIKVDENFEEITDHKQASPRSNKTFKIVHLTDVHYDPYYVVGHNAKCDQLTCCRKKQGLPGDPKDGAEIWGSYLCDSPWNVVEDVAQHVVETHSDARYIYYTGDSVDHGIWETTKEGIIATVSKMDELFREKFNWTTVYQGLGNHEGQPVDVFAPEEIINPKFSMDWLYGYVAESWRTWLPPSTGISIRRGGYYTVSPYPGFRLIVLNNNVCYTYNWWNFYNMKALTVQLDWLHDTLLEAEKAGEKVHLLLHLPPGEASCYKVWAREFKKIVERYYKTVAGQFSGHTHKDEFNLFYDRKSSQYATGVAWNGGSTTTFRNVNPSYRVYEVDEESLEVVAAETWFYNITLANQTPEERPKWEVLYKMNEAYEIQDLSPAGLDNLITRFAQNKDLLRTFWEYKMKKADPRLAAGCNDECLLTALCTIVRNVDGETEKCDKLKRIFPK